MKIKNATWIEKTVLIEVDNIPFNWKCEGTVMIDAQEYKASIVFDLPNNIAVYGVEVEDLVNKKIKFIN